MRVARGLAVVHSHPVWFLSVMGRRAVSSLKLDRVPLVASEATVSHSLKTADTLDPVWSRSPGDLIGEGDVVAKEAKVEVDNESRVLRILGDETKYGNQIVSSPIPVKANHDYVFRLPLKLEEGRALLKVTGLDPNLNQQQSLATSGVDPVVGVPPAEQALKRVEVPFVSANQSQVRLVLANNASAPGRPVVRMGPVELYELGPSRYQWTRYPRFVVRNLQRFFLTAWMLPLSIFGLIVMVRAHRGRTALLLLGVPLYYLVVQSALHTERRYVIAIHYFLTIFAAVFLWLVFRLLKEGIQRAVR
jgi:hypothetical protein